MASDHNDDLFGCRNSVIFGQDCAKRDHDESADKELHFCPVGVAQWTSHPSQEQEHGFKSC
jgi:hypothetical protein